LFFISVIAGAEGEVDQYVSEYFSVAKFRAAYAMNVPTLLGKDQWMKVDPGFKLYSTVLTRPTGRPRKNSESANFVSFVFCVLDNNIRNFKCVLSGADFTAQEMTMSLGLFQAG
jgi:hypothetical protein